MMRYVFAAVAAALLGTQANAQVVITSGYTYPSTVYTYPSTSYYTTSSYYDGTMYTTPVYTSGYSPSWSGSYYSPDYNTTYYGYPRGVYVSPRVGMWRGRTIYRW